MKQPISIRLCSNGHQSEPRPTIPDLEVAPQSLKVAASDLLQLISNLRECVAVNFFREQEFAPGALDN